MQELTNPDISQHPLSKALRDPTPPFNAILYFLTIEDNQERINDIYKQNQDYVEKSPNAHEIKQAFRIATQVQG